MLISDLWIGQRRRPPLISAVENVSDKSDRPGEKEHHVTSVFGSSQFLLTILYLYSLSSLECPIFSLDYFEQTVPIKFRPNRAIIY